MAFKAVGSLAPWGGPILRTEILCPSETFTEWDSLGSGKCQDGATYEGYACLGVAGTLVFGHLTSIVDKNGVTVDSDGASGDYEGTYTTSAQNGTVTMASGIIDISKFALYSADPDATVGTTQGSAELGWKTDIVDEDNTDESTATQLTAQYFIHGLDPQDSGNQLVNIYESAVFGL